jgi:hypothetical protein
MELHIKSNKNKVSWVEFINPTFLLQKFLVLYISIINIILFWFYEEFWFKYTFCLYKIYHI